MIGRITWTLDARRLKHVLQVADARPAVGVVLGAHAVVGDEADDEPGSRYSPSILEAAEVPVAIGPPGPFGVLDEVGSET